jgi:DNA end-binding protein Ku
MATRPIWTGYLRLSLVSCPIRIYPATSRSERISLHLLNPKTHSRVSMRPHDAETGEELERSELVRGYEFSKGRYIVLTENELKVIDLELSRTLELAKFVDFSEVDVVYLDTPYYVAPDGTISDETFRVLREAMDRSGKAGIGRVILTNRHHPLMLGAAALRRPEARCAAPTLRFSLGDERRAQELGDTEGAEPRPG